MAGDDPVNKSDPSGDDTVGICGGLDVSVLVDFNAGDCLQRTVDSSGEDDIGVSGQLGVGFGPQASLNFKVYYMFSNATTLQQLAGGFDNAEVTLDVGIGLTVGVFWNGDEGDLSGCGPANACGAPVYGIIVGVDFGGGAGGAVGVSYTWVHQFNGTITANIARGVWDSFNPGLAVGMELARARTGIAQAKASASSGTCA